MSNGKADIPVVTKNLRGETGILSQDIKSIMGQGKGTSNGNFTIVNFTLCKRTESGQEDLYDVRKEDIIRYNITRDFLSSFTDFTSIEFQLPAKEMKYLLLRNRSNLIAKVKFSVIDHRLPAIRDSAGKIIKSPEDESINVWLFSAYLLETDKFDTNDAYADNVSEEDLDKIGLVSCKMQLVYPEYEILNTWGVSCNANGVTMRDMMLLSLSTFNNTYKPKFLGNDFKYNLKIEDPDNSKKYESITTTDFILKPEDRSATVPTLLNLIYNSQEAYGVYNSGMCLYVYKELTNHKREDDEDVTLAICRVMRNVPIPLPYPVDYDPTEGTLGMPDNLDVMYEKVKKLGGRIIRLYIAPPEPSITTSEYTMGCLSTYLTDDGKEREKEEDKSEGSLDIICGSNPGIVNPSNDKIRVIGDEIYLQTKGNFPRQIDNSTGVVKRKQTEKEEVQKLDMSNKGTYEKAGEKEEESSWIKEAFSSFWSTVTKFFTNSNANEFIELSNGYLATTVKMTLDWTHGNPWLIRPGDLAEIRLEDTRGVFYFLGSITAVAWTYDAARKSCNSKLQFMGKLSHIRPTKNNTGKRPESKDGGGSNDSGGGTVGVSSSISGNTRSVSNKRTPTIPMIKK